MKKSRLSLVRFNVHCFVNISNFETLADSSRLNASTGSATCNLYFQKNFRALFRYLIFNAGIWHQDSHFEDFKKGAFAVCI